eukprot:Cvel_15164.t1-p1 / transcript=Cvel_15164.t1 / gene=Cvel_15164 / organism=Chromera_velia_CCMP2878 / gene_product=Probable protein arginine N-methyltransferase, putative / transcript_product=Probable protein arginine N-methyltransferase, putative / location=Cvel_scaffold1108:487-3648(-) / protein_length=332 / sequence_SO=supercontig / SO=protein_coding / is_pseudo=false
MEGGASVMAVPAAASADMDVEKSAPSQPQQPLDTELAEFSRSWEALTQEELSSADYYFNSYAHFGIHEEMLKDSVRTGTYQKAILQNKHLFKDKVVLDVGSGSGILSMFAARAGAKKVIGIECSEIVDVARKLVAHNGLADVIEFVQGKAEEVELPVDKVDIIVSEWMGYFLLYESMLDTVLFCRDKWLKPGGLIYPDHASLWVAAIEDGEYKEEKIGFWTRVWGFDFGVVQKVAMEEPIVDTVNSQAITSQAWRLLHLDLNTCKASDADFVSKFELKITRKDHIHALVAWFDCSFECCHRPIMFTTGPFGKYTHWKQTVFYLEDEIAANPG